jgi:phage baseplate assembly protein V
MTPAAILKLLRPLQRRVQLMVGRCAINLVNDALKMQAVQISLYTDETRDGVERLQNYGFTSNPQTGAEGVALAVGGTRNHMVVIAVDDRRYRLTGLASGEVAIYDDIGSKVVLKRGGIIQVTAPVKVDIVSPLVAMSGNATIAGTLAVTGALTGTGGFAVSGGAGSAFTGGTLTHDGVNIGKTHVHSGVQPGVGDSGAPH